MNRSSIPAGSRRCQQKSGQSRSATRWTGETGVLCSWPYLGVRGLPTGLRKDNKRNGKGKSQAEQDEGKRTGITPIARLKGHLEHIRGNKFAGMVRPAFGHYPDQIEELERADDADHRSGAGG